MYFIFNLIEVNLVYKYNRHQQIEYNASDVSRELAATLDFITEDPIDTFDGKVSVTSCPLG